jgi:Na+-driven multidrug efflux pump
MGVFGYVIEVFMTLFLGISETAITVVGYKYGEKNRMEIDDLLKTGLRLMLAAGVVAGLTCFVCSPIISELYLGKSDEALQLAVQVLRISAMGCLFYGIIIFCSSFFTGLGDGLSSMLISGMMSVACPIVLIYALPELFGRDAIWFVTPVTTVISAVLCVALLKTRYIGLMNRMDSKMDKS